MQGSCDSSDPYWSYEGVVRALMEGAADVSTCLLIYKFNYSADIEYLALNPARETCWHIHLGHTIWGHKTYKSKLR